MCLREWLCLWPGWEFGAGKGWWGGVCRGVLHVSGEVPSSYSGNESPPSPAGVT